MNRYRFIGGIVLMVLAALLFFFAETPVAVPIGVLVVGIALVASARRRSRSNPVRCRSRTLADLPTRPSCWVKTSLPLS